MTRFFLLSAQGTGAVRTEDFVVLDVCDTYRQAELDQEKHGRERTVILSEENARARYPHAMSRYYIDHEGLEMTRPLDEWPDHAT